MGIFDFFKKKEKNENGNENKQKKFTKEEVDNLILTALNVLCDDVSTVEDAKKLILSKGYDEKQSDIIVSRAHQLYLTHFKDSKVAKTENFEEPKTNNPDL